MQFYYTIALDPFIADTETGLTTAYQVYMHALLDHRISGMGTTTYLSRYQACVSQGEKS